MPRKLPRDDQWNRIKDILPGKASDRGVTAKDNRLFVEAVLWIARTGSPWRDLDPSLGNWHATYTRFSRWSKKGIWARVIRVVSDDADLEVLFIDSTAVLALQHAAGAQKRRQPGARSLAGRVEHQDSCSGGFFGQSAALDTDRWPNGRYHASALADRRAAYAGGRG